VALGIGDEEATIHESHPRDNRIRRNTGRCPRRATAPRRTLVHARRAQAGDAAGVTISRDAVARAYVDPLVARGAVVRT
jgi:hypothetical protein